MKAVFVLAALLANQSWALSEIESSDGDPIYLSWCEKNKVMNEDSEGNIRLVANCAAQNQICKPVSFYRGYHWVYTATCANPK